MSPRLAVAVNLAQFAALFNQSRFSLRKTSLVVPKCMRPLQRMVALWVIELRPESCSNKYEVRRTLHYSETIFPSLIY